MAGESAAAETVAQRIEPTLKKVFAPEPVAENMLAASETIAAISRDVAALPAVPGPSAEIRATGLRICELMRMAGQKSQADRARLETSRKRSATALEAQGGGSREEFFAKGIEREWRTRIAELSASAWKAFERLSALEAANPNLATVNRSSPSQPEVAAQVGATPPRRLTGKVLSVLDGGILVSCKEPAAVRSRIGSIGGGGAADGGGSELNDYGVFYVTGHPAERNLADQDEIDVFASPGVPFRYTASSGAAKTVRSYRFIRIAK